MKNIIPYLILFVSVLTFNSCTENEVTDFNYISFAKTTYSAGVDVGGTLSMDVDVYSSKIENSARNIEITVDEASTAAVGSFTVPATVTIPSGSNKGTLKINLADVDLGIGTNKLILNFGTTSGLFNGASTTINYIQNCSEVTATLKINFDGYGSETSWSIIDSNGGIVKSKAAGSYTDGQVSATENITLCAGRTFTLKMNDSFGDGLSFPVDGNYSLTIGGVVKASGQGNFGSTKSSPFDTK